MAWENHGSQCSPAGGTLLPATRHTASFTTASDEGSVGGKPETDGDEVTTQDSLYRSDSRSSVGRTSANTHRFRTKRQLWNYSGLALETHNSGEYRFEGGQLKRSKKTFAVRGLNKNHNHDVKNIFKSAAIRATTVEGPFQNFYEALVAKGMKPTMARLTLARKIAAITLIVWKKGVRFDAEHLKQQAA